MMTPSSSSSASAPTNVSCPATSVSSSGVELTSSKLTSSRASSMPSVFSILLFSLLIFLAWLQILRPGARDDLAEGLALNERDFGRADQLEHGEEGQHQLAARAGALE